MQVWVVQEAGQVSQGKFTILTQDLTTTKLLCHIGESYYIYEASRYIFVTILLTSRHVLLFAMHGKRLVIFQFCKRDWCKTVDCVLIDKKF